MLLPVLYGPRLLLLEIVIKGELISTSSSINIFDYLNLVRDVTTIKLTR